MPKPRPYKQTQVPIEQTRQQMLKLMHDYDVLDPLVEVYPPYIYRQDGQRTSPMKSQGGSIHVEFQWLGQRSSARYVATLSDYQQGDGQLASDFRQDMHQELRIAGRTMFYMLKSTFEFISAGFLREQVGLFAWTVLPDGTTVAEKPDAELAHLVGASTPLIPAKAGPDAHGHDIARRDR